MARILVVLVAMLGVAYADDAASVTLGQALAAAERAPDAQIGGHDIAAAEASIAVAAAWPNPSLQVATNRLTARLVVGASVPLPVFGTVGAARRVAAADAQIVRAEADLALRDLRHRVVSAWIELARAGGDVVTQAAAARQAAELVAVAEGRRAAGTGADVDVTVAAAARARADVAAASAVRSEQAASAELAALLAWDPARRLRADGAPLIGPGSELDTLRSRLRGHPERIAAERRIASADANIARLASERWPGLALEAELDYDDRSVTEGRTAWDRSDARIGVVLDLPLFAKIGDRTRAVRAMAQAQRARLAALDAALAGRLAAAHARWQATAERLTGLERDVLPAIQRAATLSRQAYREGARDLSFALIAERDLTMVRAEINDALAAAALAFADLAAAVGEDLHAN